MFNIKALRIKKGISQSELASHLGVTLRTIQHWEKGSKNITVDKLDRINNYFGLNMNLYQDNEDLVKLLSVQESEIEYAAENQNIILELEKKIKSQDKQLEIYKEEIKKLQIKISKVNSKK